YNVHTLEVLEDSGFFAHAILHNIDNLGTLVNQQDPGRTTRSVYMNPFYGP
ncbi:unnamed protein product, partial [Rotaria socialis]